MGHYKFDDELDFNDEMKDNNSNFFYYYYRHPLNQLCYCTHKHILLADQLAGWLDCLVQVINQNDVGKLASFADQFALVVQFENTRIIQGGSNNSNSLPYRMVVIVVVVVPMPAGSESE